MTAYKTGKKPARHDPRTLRYSKYRSSSAPTPPGESHWGHGLPFTVLANDRYGDCVEAGFLHQVQVWCDRAGSPFVPDDTEALTAYSAISGFDPGAGPPGNNPSDTGTDMLSACNYWRSPGAAGHSINSFLSVSPGETDFIKDSIALYGGLYAGLAMPLSAQDQVGSLWEVATGPGSSAGSWGGHCVILTGYDSERLWCCTWGALQAMTWQWLETYLDEGYVLLSHDFMETSGVSPSHLQWGQLQADIANL